MNNKRKLDYEELSAFCLRVAYPVKAGVSAAECISLMLEETSSKQEKQILQPVCEHMDAGMSLSEALQLSGYFPEYMVRMLQVGEASGKLDAVLEDLAGHYTKEAQITASLRQAIMGPGLMLLGMLLLLVILITEVLPIFNQVYMQMGTELTGAAAVMLSAGQTIRSILPICAGVALVIFAACGIYFSGGNRNMSFGGVVDRIFFKGKLDITIARSRFASAMSLMSSSGLSLDASLEKGHALLAETRLAKPIEDCRMYIARGDSFSEACSKSGLFTGSWGGILSAGFKAGSFDKAFDEIEVRMRAQSEDMLGSFVSRIEPAMIIALSATVAMMLMSVMLPLISMLTSVGA